NPEVGAALGRALAKLNREESANLAEFLFGAPPEVPARHRMLYLFSALAIACPFGLYFSLWFLPAAVVLWSCNILLSHVYGTRLVRHSPALISLGILLG